MERERELSRLLRLEKSWEAQEREEDDPEWLARGVSLYRTLITLEPQASRFRTALARLLMRHGRDIKLRLESNRQARPLFEEALALEPDHPVAHYHLGHLDLHDRDWRGSQKHFRVVTNSESPSLSAAQRIRAHCGSAIVCIHLGQSDLAEVLLQRAKDLDQQRQYRSEIETVWHMLPQQDVVYSADSPKDFIMVTREGSIGVNRREMNELLEDEEFVRLDLSSRPRFLCPPEQEADGLGDVQARILLCLLTKSGQTVTATELRNFVDRATLRDNVKTHIHRLREKLRPYLADPVNQVLITVENGYKWCHPLPYRIFLPSDWLEQI